MLAQAKAVDDATGTFYRYYSCATTACNAPSPPPSLLPPSPPPPPPPSSPPPPPYPPFPPSSPGAAYIHTADEFLAAAADPSVVRFVVAASRIALRGSPIVIPERKDQATGLLRDFSIEASAAHAALPCPPELLRGIPSYLPLPAACGPVIDAGGLSQAIVVERAGQLLVQSLTLANGRAAGTNSSGGCLSASSVFGLLRGVVFSGCRADRGNGGAAAFDRAVIVVGGAALGVSSGAAGGAFAASTITVNGTLVSGARSTGNGGAAFAQLLLIEGATFHNTSAGDSGGAGYGEIGVRSVGASFQSASAAKLGGALATATGNVNASGCSFRSCTAASGGAVAGGRAGTQLASCSFSGCAAADAGGAVFIAAGALATGGCTFSDSRATTGGCVSVSAGGALSDSGSAFDGCRASLAGGAIYVPQARAIIPLLPVRSCIRSHSELPAQRTPPACPLPLQALSTRAPQ